MKSHNATNERIKRDYFELLKEAKAHSEPSVDAVAMALSRFEEYTGFRDFRAFRYQQAVAFKKHLSEQTNAVSGERLSKATLYATLAHLKRFFQWLAWRPGFKKYLDYSDAEFFNLSGKDARVATARRERPSPTMEQIKTVIGLMPAECEIDLRDRALVAFMLLTGVRDGEIPSMKLKHVNIAGQCVFHDAREVETKFSKTSTTYFFVVGAEVLEIVTAWVSHLRQEKLWGNDDPLFPATQVRLDADRHFVASGLKREHWSTASPIRDTFRTAFNAAALPYFNPHAVRKTLALLGQSVCRTAEEYKAWSQNLGHEHVLTTFRNYGEVESRRQGEIIRSLGTPRPVELADASEFAKVVAHELQMSGAVR